MPAGNSLGPRGKFIYISDNGLSVTLKTDQTLGELDGTGLVEGSGTTTRPTGFQFRGVYAQSQGTAAVADPPTAATPFLRKFIVCNRVSTLYGSDEPQTIAIDGRNFTTTGRRGEKFSF